MNREVECTAPVLIAGAGPAGLTAAVTLAREGVESLVVDRKRDLSDLPRATVISTALDGDPPLVGPGRADPGREESRSSGRCGAASRSTLASEGSAIPVGLPTREQSAVISPTSPACVPQDHTESVLLGHLESLGCSRVEFGTEIVETRERRGRSARRAAETSRAAARGSYAPAT